MNRIQMPSRNVICRVKFGRFWTFDRRRPSWILRKIKNSSTGLFLGSTSMSMPNFIQIRRTGSKCQAKMWFLHMLKEIIKIYLRIAEIYFRIFSNKDDVRYYPTKSKYDWNLCFFDTTFLRPWIYFGPIWFKNLPKT